MAVRFNADSDWISLALDIGGAGHVNFTLEGWFYLEEFNDSAGILAAGHASNGRALRLLCDNDFPTPRASLGDSQTGQAPFATQPPLNTWVFMQLSSPNVTGGTVTARWSELGDDTVYSVTRTNGVEASVQAQQVLVNRKGVGDANGFTGGLRAAYVRGYTGPSTEAEFLARKTSASPAGALFWWDLADDTDTADQTGNGRVATFNGALTSEASPSFGPPQPILYYRKFPYEAAEAGDMAWLDSTPGSAILRNEFFGLQEAGPPALARSARASARPRLAASRLATAVRAGLARQRAQVAASRALTAARGAAAKARPEVSASRAVTTARGAIARARAKAATARTTVLARVARATAVTRAAATVVIQTLSTYSRAARASARAIAAAARTAVLARAARAAARGRAAATRVAGLVRTAAAAARPRLAAARAVALQRLARASARSRAAAVRLVALARPGAARARPQAQAERAIAVQRTARASARARTRAIVEKIVGQPLTRPGRLFMHQPVTLNPAPAIALAAARDLRWSDPRAIAFRPLLVAQWVARE